MISCLHFFESFSKLLIPKFSIPGRFCSMKRKRTTTKKTSEPAKKQKVEKLVEKTSKTNLNSASNDFSTINFEFEGKPWNYKIASFNIAGLRAWIQKKNGLSYLKAEKPDILCLQEIKCAEKDLPEECHETGYHAYWWGNNSGHNGVALLSRSLPIEIKYGFDSKFDEECRSITAEFEKFYLVNTYVPNAGRGLKTLDKRLEWNTEFHKYLSNLDKKKPVILAGDLNVAHEEIDLKNPKTNKKNAGFTKEERDGMTDLLSLGFVDTFRHLYPDKVAYTFWSNMNNARAKDVGWRLDYFLVSERIMKNVVDSQMRKEVMGSDHCPILLYMNF